MRPRLCYNSPVTMQYVNLAGEVKNKLPARALSIMDKASRLASARGEKLFLAGGAVRDLLLGRPVLDVDLLLEGDATVLATELAQGEDAQLTLHKPFLTASLHWPDLSMDLTTARRESYARAGMLPDIQPGNLKDDLRRRDFSINAMAISLNPADYGLLIDFYGGLEDLNNKLVRILHDQSFSDDATRLWRAVRYEQRLGFHIEEGTQKLLERDLPMLATISGERIWYEMECAFGETLPEKVFIRASELGILAYLDTNLRGGGWLSAWFEDARRLSLPQKPTTGLYLTLLTYKLDTVASEKIRCYLNLNKTLARTLHDSQKIKTFHEELSEKERQPSAIYLHLQSYSEDAIITNLIACEAANVRLSIQRYMDELRYVKTSLNGDDLIALGMKQGPRIKLLLGLLLNARLDGEVTTRDDELQLLKKFS